MAEANPESILDSTKKIVGFDPGYTAFDLDVITFINSAIGTLQQAGVGSDTGFVITDNTTLWSQYVGDLLYLGMVKAYIYMSVRLAFDPPATSFAIEAINKQLEQLIWRINVAVETAMPPTDPFALEAILENFPGEEVLYQGGIMPTYFAPKVIPLDFASVITPDASRGNVFTLELTGNCTINTPINAANGEHISIGLKSNGYDVTWGNGWNFGDSGAPVLSAGGKVDVLSSYYKQSTSEWLTGVTTGF